MVALEIVPDFGWVVAVTGLITLQYTLVTFAVAPVRYKHFTEEYIKKHLSAEDEAVKKLTGKGIGKGCHPDPGLGRFSDKLSVEAWMELNVAQRAAGNYLEQITPIVTLELLSGLFYPRVSASIGVAYLVGRFLYTRGFKSKSGTGARGTGFGIAYLSHAALLAITIFSGVRLTGVLSRFGL
eukprot:c46404_g1_i1.p1 GENE.c46404_g1_i1~~c46404_g1_i1.p1  ORF type:complete len:205 (+),score=48.91 c46404_g1_i1:72-617(+)